MKGSHLPHAGYSPVAQSVERLPVKQNVTGSSPVGRVRRGIAVGGYFGLKIDLKSILWFDSTK